MDPDELSDLREEYQKEFLKRNMLSNDPVEQFSGWFKVALDTEAELEPNGMVLSTVSADGQPSGRVVLLKKVTDEGFVFYTNYHSSKGHDLAHNTRCALTFWWRTLQQQVRVQGMVEKVSESDSARYFNSRPVESQLSAAISPQSEVIKDRTFLEQRLAALRKSLPEGSSPTRPEHWGGYLVKPSSFEFWQGRANRLHDRFKYVRHGSSWEIHRLAP